MYVRAVASSLVFITVFAIAFIILFSGAFNRPRVVSDASASETWFSSDLRISALGEGKVEDASGDGGRAVSRDSPDLGLEGSCPAISCSAGAG